jgi:hypothetical protein
MPCVKNGHHPGRRWRWACAQRIPGRCLDLSYDRCRLILFPERSLLFAPGPARFFCPRLCWPVSVSGSRLAVPASESPPRPHHRCTTPGEPSDSRALKVEAIV